MPDFIANAGGVICAAVELAGGTEADAMQMIDDKIRGNLRRVLELSAADNELPRAAAAKLSRARVLDAMANNAKQSQK